MCWMQDQRVQDQMRTETHTISQLSCCIWLGTQRRTQLLVQQPTACTCIMDELEKKEKKHGTSLLHFNFPFSPFSLALSFNNQSDYVTRNIVVVTEVCCDQDQSRKKQQNIFQELEDKTNVRLGKQRRRYLFYQKGNCLKRRNLLRLSFVLLGC